MMKKFLGLIFLSLALVIVQACAPAAQPTSAPTAIPTLQLLPTSAPASAPTTVPTFIPTRQPSATARPKPTAEPTPDATTGPVITDPTLLKLIDEARADLAQRQGIAAAGIGVKSAEPVEWRDSSLGCPVEGLMYAQVITPGYLIVLESGGQEYEYHASTNHVALCEK